MVDKADGYNFIGLSGQAEAVDKESYPNRRSWKLDSDGRRVVEPKDKTKERIKRSPDGLDGMNLAYCVPPIKKAKAVKMGIWKR